MSKFLRFMCLALLLAIPFGANAEMTKEEIRNKILDNVGGKPNNALGYDFYVAIAPNEAESYSYDPYIELYIAAQEPTEVDMYYAGNKVETFKLTPFVVKVIKLDYRKCEIRKSETPLKQMYRFVSKNWPISVYELNAKSATTDGAMILPVVSYGTEYIHCSYWENGESKNNYFKSGFIVMSPEDNTNITINLKSAQNVTYGKTDKGRVPGESWKVTLNKGECYKVCTDAGTIGEFDISGTKITSDKPVGLVCFHERATLPRLMASSRNHLVEMIPPTTTWGKDYYSIQFNRAAGGGDLFRIICKEPQTSWRAVWYDIKTGVQKGGDNGTLVDGGDFVEIVDSPQGRPYPSFQSVNGTSRFWADKPIQVFQYSFSTSWDGSNDYDPFYITICPQENYTDNTVFQVPSNKGFDQNWFNLLAVGDTSDAANNLKLLSSIRIMQKVGSQVDTTMVLKTYPQLLSQRIPGTAIFWTTMSMTGGAYTIKAKTNFGGYIYGFAGVDGYGWPAASSYSNTHEKDVVPPAVDDNHDQCGNWTIHFTEKVVDPPNSDPEYIRQVDLGVIDAPKLMDTSFNAKIEFPNSAGVFPNDPPQKDYTFTVHPINMKKDMYAIVAITDKAYNVSYDTVYYFAPIIVLNPSDTVDFGKHVRLRTKPVKSVFVENKTAEALNIYGIFLKNNDQNVDGKPFKINEGGYLKNTTTPFQLGVGESRELKIQYNADKDNVAELDSIIVMTKCDVVYAYPVKAKATMPVIKVEECDYLTVSVGKTKPSTDRVAISNTGTDTLMVFGYTNTNPTQPFTANVAATPVNFPIKLAPGKRQILNNFGLFSPLANGNYNTDIVFSHDGDHEVAGDSISVWVGKSAIPGPRITDASWDRTRVNSLRLDTIEVRNEGTEDLQISAITFEDNASYTSTDGNFTINDNLASNKTIKPYTGDPAKYDEEVAIVVVTYKPQTEGKHSTRVKATFNGFTAKGEKGTDIGTVDGEAFLPKLAFSGYNFPNILDVSKNEQANCIDTAFIQSTSTSAPLTVSKFTLLPGGNQADFNIQLMNKDIYTSDYTGAANWPVNGPKNYLNINFAPKSSGAKELRFEIEHDAVMGNGVDVNWTPKKDTLVITGRAKFPGSGITGYDFPLTIACDAVEGVVTLKNTSPSEIMYVDSISFSKNKDVFLFLDPTSNLQVAPSGTLPVKILFAPGFNVAQKDFTADVTAYGKSESGTPFTETEGVTGHSYTTGLELSLPTLTNMVAGMNTTGNYKVNVNLKTKNTVQKWAQTSIDSFKVSITYDQNAMKFNKISNLGPALAGWDGKVTATTAIAAGKETLTLTGVGGPIIATDGDMFDLDFQLLLFNKTSFDINFGDISLESRNACITTKGNPGKVSYTSCVQNLRNVKFTGTEYSVKAIVPNPVTNSNFDINFSVGLNQVQTKLEIINSMGEVVKVLHDGLMDSGDYKATVDASQLSSGVYYINMVSGPYKQQEKVVISK